MKIRAGYYQFKPYFCEPEKNSETIYKTLSRKSFDLMVIPELANSGYFFSNQKEVSQSSEVAGDGVFTKTMIKLAKEKSAVIVAGFCERDKNRFYNSAIICKPSGRFFLYRKTHLFNEEKIWFKPGNTGFKTFSVKCKNGVKYRIGVLICFDWIFPESVRALALSGSQVICHPANLVLKHCQKAMYVRAVENKVFTITANRTGTDGSKGRLLKFTGQSIVYDPEGKILTRSKRTVQEVKTVLIEPQKADLKRVNKFNDVLKDRATKFYS